MSDYVILDGVSYHGQCNNYYECEDDEITCEECKYHRVYLDPTSKEPVPSSQCICASKSTSDCACGAWWFRGYDCV